MVFCFYSTLVVGPYGFVFLFYFSLGPHVFVSYFTLVVGPYGFDSSILHSTLVLGPCGWEPGNPVPGT